MININTEKANDKNITFKAGLNVQIGDDIGPTRESLGEEAYQVYVENLRAITGT